MAPRGGASRDSHVREAPVRIVVTGGTGHVGRAVTRELASRGHLVVAPGRTEVDLERDSSVAALKDMLDPESAVVHLAAWVPPATSSTTAADRRRLLEANVLGTMRVLEAASGGVAVVVFASSFEVYGAPLADPIDENHPTHPLTDYGATKLAGEDHALAFAYEANTRVVCLRMPAVYGPGEHTPRALPLFLRAVARGDTPVVHGDGGDARDLLYVDDAARAVALAVERDVRGIFNVADGERHTIDEIARIAMRVAGMSGEPSYSARAKARLDYHMSIERARRELGFSPRVTLEQGMSLQWEQSGKRALPQTP